jgi:hypothetical protein
MSTPNCFKTASGFRLNAFSKFPSLLVEKSPLWTKTILFQRKMVSKPLKRFSTFKRKAVLIPFSTQFGFKSYWRKSLKTRLLSKVLKFCFRETKVLRFNQ